MAFVFPDNTVLCNFACIDGTSLLVDHLRGRGRWTEAVAREAQQSVQYLPDLGTLLGPGSPLGEPIRIEGVEDSDHVEKIRRNVFGGTQDKLLQHLGEAQTCFLLTTDPAWAGATWITDDREAGRYARYQGIVTWGTVDLVRALVADGDLTAEQAFTHLRAIDVQRPGLSIPDRPDDLR